MNLHHPAFESVLLPLLVALVATGALRVLGSTRMASSAIPISMLFSALLILGVPSWPAQSGLQKFVYIVAGGLVLGLALDLRRPASPRLLSLAVLWLAVLCLWLAWSQLDQVATWSTLAGLALAGLIVLGRVVHSRPSTLGLTSLFLVAAVGLGGIALASGSLVIAQLSFALAAALGGFALWNWPRPRYPFGAAALFGGGLALFALAALALLLTDAPPWSVAVLVLVFFSDLVSRRLPSTDGSLRQALEPVYLVAVAAVPAAVGVGLAVLSGQAGDLYYR